MPTSNDVTSPPSSAWVRFLRSYGPTPNNTTLFDEYVSAALGKAKVRPILLSSPLLDQLKARAASASAGSILIAGTAGDGKTYHCRSLWTEMGGQDKEWAAATTLKELRVADGRLAVFVKDLSELPSGESDRALAILERSALGDDDEEFVVIAANHGQILDRLRELGARQGRAHPLRKSIQDAFLLQSPPPDRLAIFDLSRTTSRDSLEEVLSAVAGHPEWENCARCPLKDEGRICPIFENRKRLLRESDGGKLPRRLGDLVEVARLNGWHLPVRDLLALTANMILGHRDAKEGLMACSDIARIQANGAEERGSLYANIFGANLPRLRAMDRAVFRALSSFGIGEETTNVADGLLVYGRDDARLSPAFEKLVEADTVYGATAGYLSAQRRYLEGEEAARTEDGPAEFLARLAGQRRRLFFTLPDGDVEYPHWDMTAFKSAGEYLALTAALVAKKPISEATRTQLARGLNRVMTGLLIDNAERVFVASSGGFTQSRVSVLCDTEAPSRRQDGRGMQVRINSQSGKAMLDMALAPGAGNSVTFDLTPIRFEFLSRVAEGSLPGSFSNECLEDLLAFKAKLLRRAEILKKARLASGDDEGDADDGALTLNFIEIEQSGHGFSRPVTVRAAA